MGLLELIYPKYKIISIVGTAKNAGKTVCLNEIIAQAEEKAVILGLISTGRDGERRDVLTDTDKPPIFVRKGTIITTVESRIKSGTKNEFAALEILSVTNYTTPMGRVILGRALEDGYAEISGPRSASTIKSMCDEMLRLGAQLVLIDGSLDRRASAAPYVSEGTILSTGASLARSMDLVMERTQHIVKIYSIPQICGKQVAELARELIEEGRTAVISKDLDIKYIDTLTTLQCGSLIAEKLDESSEYVVLSGSATVDTIKQLLLNKKSDLQIVVKDPTRVFIPHNEYLFLQKMGMNIRVLDSVNIIAITVNPYSPEGYFFDSEQFLLRVKTEIPQIPAFDVMQGGY